jgi:Leucine-rich repeat (LRR) protein
MKQACLDNVLGKSGKERKDDTQFSPDEDPLMDIDAIVKMRTSLYSPHLAKAFIETLNKEKLTCLDVSRTKLCQKGADLLADSIGWRWYRKGIALVSLDVRSNPLGRKGGAAFVEAVKTIPTLRLVCGFGVDVRARSTLDLAHDAEKSKLTLGICGSVILSHYLSSRSWSEQIGCKGLTKINLPSNRLGEIELETGVSGRSLGNKDLYEGATVRYKGFWVNIFRADEDSNSYDIQYQPGLSSIAQGLRHQPKSALATLNLTNNEVCGRDGVSYLTGGLFDLCDSFRHNAAITSLDLSHNNLKRDGLLLIAKTLQLGYVPKLRALNLSANDMGQARCEKEGEDAVGMLIKALGGTPQLRTLRVADVGISDANLRMLLRTLSAHKAGADADTDEKPRALSKLKNVDLSSNEITSVGAAALADVLSAGVHEFKHLDLSANPIGTDQVSGSPVCQLTQIHTNTDGCLVAFCTWILTTRELVW